VSGHAMAVQQAVKSDPYYARLEIKVSVISGVWR
jgi:hypothetical protein